MENATRPKQALIFIGAPASGKDTVAAPFQSIGFDIVGPGKMLRDERERGTELAKQADANIDKITGLVRSDIIMNMVRDRIERTMDMHHLFNGVPRTIEQARELDELLLKEGILPENTHIICLDVSEDNLRARVAKRYNDAVAAGKTPRAEDTPEGFEKRLANEYKPFLQAAKAYYGNRMHFIDANHTPEKTLWQMQALTGLSLPPESIPRPAPAPLAPAV